MKAMRVYESEGFYVMWFLLESMLTNGFQIKMSSVKFNKSFPLRSR